MHSLTGTKTPVGRAPEHENVGAIGSVLENAGIDPVRQLCRREGEDLIQFHLRTRLLVSKATFVKRRKTSVGPGWSTTKGINGQYNSRLDERSIGNTVTREQHVLDVGSAR